LSKERARARAARVAARQAEVAAAAEERERIARRAARRPRPTLPSVPRAIVQTLLAVAIVELLAWLFPLSLRVRLGLGVVTLAVLFVYLVSARRSPTR
jgi:Flp pilus assembly protein TadB